MTDRIEMPRLVWGATGDLEMVSDGGGEFASAFKLTPRGIAKLTKALGWPTFLDGEMCACPNPREGDGIHEPGEPVATICFATPIPTSSASQAQGADQ